jgi:predicted DNA-binding transcriptional regulator AlpA
VSCEFATTFRGVGREVDLDDLLDAREVAELLGLSSANAVNVYRGRYKDFPEPVLVRPGFRLWLRSDVEAWARETRRRAPR